MPELPEVEVLRRSLTPLLGGRRFGVPLVRETRLREVVSPAALEGLAGRRVEAVRRRAKYLLVDCEGGVTLVVHLGMSGRLTVRDEDAPAERHEHIVLPLDDGRTLRFRDPRRFGLVAVEPTATLAAGRHLCHLGIEPLDGGLDGATLRRLAGGRRGPVKTFLMDGTVVVGVGNIYASEALFAAGVHPRRSVARISPARWEGLATAVREVLEEAVAQGGTTLNDFADGAGQSGYFQVSLAVYGRAGEPCPQCGAAIRRQLMAGRSTFHCPRCQR